MGGVLSPLAMALSSDSLYGRLAASASPDLPGIPSGTRELHAWKLRLKR